MAGSFGAAAAAGNRIFSLLDAEEVIPDPQNCIVPEPVSYTHLCAQRYRRAGAKEGAVFYKNIEPLFSQASINLQDILPDLRCV